MASSGRDNLNLLVQRLRGLYPLPVSRHPIVLVAGFASFGDPFLGSINYWGGFEDLAAALATHTGVPVIVPRLGPFSSNWERACELYCQLWNIQRAGPGTGFDLPTALPSGTRIEVDYGQYITLPTSAPHRTKQAIVHGTLPEDWKWDTNKPVHMICHSQGGNTVRLLIELLSGSHGNWNPSYFGAALGDRRNYIRSVVTLGTPFLGTTITDVIFNEILRNAPLDEVISRLVVSASLNPGRFVDLQLEHWRFAPLAGDTFMTMYNRLRPDILAWWTSDNNAVKDNGIAGIARLNRDFAPRPSPATYYFTMSFDATRPFPQMHLSGDEIASFPLHPLLPLGGLGFPGPFNIVAHSVAAAINAARAIPGTPTDLDYARFAVNFLNGRLGMLGYQIRLPSPGGRIPLAEMLPVLSIFSVGMSGMSRTSGFSEQNDGVVDTSSMRAPEGGPVQEFGNFETANLGANMGIYTHLGLTEGVDHADEVGVFTDPATYNVVLQIYQRLGDLLSAL